MAQVATNETTNSIPEKMKAIVCTKYGDPKDVLKIIDVEKPKPKDDEILIEIYSVALNPVDYKMVKGWMSTLLKKKFPWIVGRDFAGIIRFIGSKVNKNVLNRKKLSIGSSVCGMIDHYRTHGTFAQYLCVKLPYVQPFDIEKMNFNQAASVPLTGMTSYQAIMKKGALKKDGKVLILGGSSGCGVYGIQIAKCGGAKEITVTSSKEEFCKSLGATNVINYKNENEAVWYKHKLLKDQNYDVIFDCVGGKESWENAVSVLDKKDGHFVTIVGDEKHGKPMSINGLLSQGMSLGNRKFWSFFGNPSYHNFLMDATDGLDKLIKLINDGFLKPILDENSPYDFDQFLQMFEKQMAHTAHGKLVLQIKTYQTQKQEQNDDDKEDEKQEEKTDAVAVDDDDAPDHDPNKDVHITARSSPYANSGDDGVINRFEISDEEVPWKNECKNYQPTKYTHSSVLKHKVPDKCEEDIKNEEIEYKFNEIDGKIDRRSFLGKYELDSDYYNLPKNPIGRTGVCGRGLLWRWGPNHAADPIVTRWQREEKTNEIICDKQTNKPILEFVSIERTDGGGWAIPGGMVDPGEQISRTLKREFGEETMDSHGIKTEEEKKKLSKLLDAFFTDKGVEIYKGYCDDPRNTDNAWMETVAVNFHDENGDIVAKWKLKAGDDASKVQWMPISKDVKLYASHNAFIRKVVKLHNAHW